jgi:hypothetical protein
VQREPLEDWGARRQGGAFVDASQLLGLLAQTLAETDPGMPMPSRLCRACVEIFGAQSGALTVAAAPDERLTVSTSDGLSGEIESLEDVLGEGPGRLAFTQDRIVIAQVDRHDEVAAAFPVFSQLVETITGPATFVAVPLHVDGRVVGVLSLYFTTGRLTREEADMQVLADAVGLALVDELDSLDWSVRSRIHQATGMVTAQLRIVPEDALAILRAHAFVDSTTLEAVADEVVGRRLVFVRDESNVVKTVRSEEA